MADQLPPLSEAAPATFSPNGSAAHHRPSLPSQRISAPQLDGLALRVTTAAERPTAVIEQPFTGQALGEVPRCTPDDVKLAFERAREAQEEWAHTSFATRRRILLRYHDLLLEHQQEALDLLQMEAGKARRHAFEEVLDVATVARYYANTARHHLRPRRRRGAMPVLTQTWEHHQPVGVVGMIAPWNYPLTLTLGDIIPAFAAGNAAVCKPDSQTPFTALWGAELLERAGLPPGLFQIVTGSGAELGPHIIDGSDFVMFTGSTKTGREVAGRAGNRLIGTSMELGGKNAMIVLDDASVSRAVEGAERALFSNAGQLCISIERLLVQEGIADEFTSRLVERTRGMKLTTGLDYKADMGSLISSSQLATVTEHVDDAVAKGARVLAGGRPRPDIGPYFYEPTLLDGVEESMTLCRNETFGPVVAISRFATPEEAIRKANDSEYGLNYSVWTADTRAGRRIATQLKAGTVNVNEGYIATWGSVDAPMGGMKASGMGRRHGASGITKYTEQQTISVQRLLPIAPPPAMPAGVWARMMTGSLRLLRRVPGVR
jgi:succinate-semialdehyde dehydrogenase/glutarate-semialdehyde dehydrogenase